MTSLTYTTHMFVFVFLNAMDLSEAKCWDHLDPALWGGNITDTYSLVKTEDLKSTVKCTLEPQCFEGRIAACHLLRNCFSNITNNSTECKGKLSEEIHFLHFMCLIAKVFNYSSSVSSKACEYGTVCKMYSEPASTHYDLTTTPPPTTTTLPETTPPPTTTTTLPETTTATTTTTLPEITALPSATKAGITTLEPTATLPETATLLPSPPTTATMESTATTLEVGQRDAKRNGDEKSDPQKYTTADNLKYFFVLSLLFNVILPLAVFLYMRHQWMSWTSIHLSNGNVTGDQAKTASDAPSASSKKDTEFKMLLQPDIHSIRISVNAETQTDF